MNRTPLVLIFSFAAACRRDPPPRPNPPPVPSSNRPPATTPQPGAPPATSVDPPAPADAFRETARFLPQGTPTPGWTQAGAVRVVNGQELFQLIDGAGEKYISYGFRQLGRTDYRKVGTELVATVEVYDMTTTLGAFGQYSMLLSDSRDPGSMASHAVALGASGFLGTSQLVFWKDHYLVQINLADDSGEQDESALGAIAHEVLPALGAVVARALPGEVVGTTTPGRGDAAPPESRVLPSDGLVWGGATYLTNNVFGLEQTGPGWVGHYGNAENQRHRVAVLTRPSVPEAHALFLRFRGAASSPLAGVGDEAFSDAHFVAARKGSTVVVVGEASPENLPQLPAAARVTRLRAVVATLP